MTNNTISDPAAIVRQVTEKKIVLGLDLGTTTGVSMALYSPGEPITPALIKPEFMGNWNLGAGPYDSGAIRFVRLRHFLSAVRPDMVFFEDVRFTPPVGAKMNPSAIMARAATSSEFFGALKGTLSSWCEEHGVPCTSFPIGAIKKRATNRGNANKEMIITACNEMFGAKLDPEGYATTGEDNIADSAWVLLLGLEQYAAGL
jgi:Holliday junction resolvasome RuvABC endonuclease subunit